MIDLDQLIDWLGTSGAIAGLLKTELTSQEILDATSSEKPIGFSKMKREDVIEAVVLKKRAELTKSPDELMQLDSDSLRIYFSKMKFSRDELLHLLETLDIRPGSIARKNLLEFAAKEISDIGMYKRVSKGQINNDIEDLESHQVGEEFRFRYQKDGDVDRKEISVLAEKGYISDRDVAIAILMKEYPKVTFSARKNAEAMLREYGITNVTKVVKAST
jgi:hypothetical protein